MKRLLLVSALLAGLASCDAPKSGRLRLAVLDPGHFHAALLQKNPLAELSDTVRVYAPDGVEVEQYLRAVAACNERPEHPTAWVERVCIGDDYLERMFADGQADVVVLAGNNRRKTEYLSQAVKHGIHVLADKPLAIDRRGFELLEEAYGEAAARGCVICDLMTERYDVLNILTRELLQDRDVFGELLAGTAEEPAVTMRSVHHFYKEV
ncbi:MAG: Gfo/Idh/MocA family oxidoreductase, partial [Alistipes sp.]|nr:Gfo/Idh/MocA family oxidoreductase [Alistipes sp.]